MPAHLCRGVTLLMLLPRPSAAWSWSSCARPSSIVGGWRGNISRATSVLNRQRLVRKRPRSPAATIISNSAGSSASSPPPPCASLRLERLLANRGLGSRKECDKLIRQGRVMLDGRVVKKPAEKFREDSVFTVLGEEVGPNALLMAFYKPKGIITTMGDDWDREHLKDVLPESVLRVFHPVGRLDADSQGLLLLSSSGQLTHKLLQPKYGIEREYLAAVEPKEDSPPPGDALRKRLEAGVETSDGTFTARVTAIEGNSVRLVVAEGKYRMVRRMLSNAGYPVTDLTRVRYGQVGLGGLEEGEWEEVGDAAAAWAAELLLTPGSAATSGANAAAATVPAATGDEDTA